MYDFGLRISDLLDSRFISRISSFLFDRLMIKVGSRRFRCLQILKKNKNWDFDPIGENPKSKIRNQKSNYVNIQSPNNG